MAKKGMKRIERTNTQTKNDMPPVPEIQGKAKHGKVDANPIIEGTVSPYQKVYHNIPYSEKEKIPDVYKAIDNDLARDNLENHLPAEDVQDI